MSAGRREPAKPVVGRFEGEAAVVGERARLLTRHLLATGSIVRSRGRIQTSPGTARGPKQAGQTRTPGVGPRERYRTSPSQ